MKKLLIISVFCLTALINVLGQERSQELLNKAIYEEEINGNLNKAIEIYQTIIKRFPDNNPIASKAQLHIGLCYEKLGLEEAQKAYRAVVNNYPGQTEMVALAKQRLAQLVGISTEVAKKAEQSFRLASDFFKQSEYEPAIKEYEKVISLIPNSQLAQEAQLWIGNCYFKQGKNEQALQSFNIIIKEFPRSTIIPVTELMISQVQQAFAEKPKTSTTIALDDKTILDTVTGIRYTQINSWAGKNDIIKSATDITNISPNRKFLLYENLVVPFDNTDAYALFDSISAGWISRLSPDGSEIATITKNSLLITPVSQETGQKTGSAKKLISGQFNFPRNNNNYASGLNWSSNGENLVFSAPGENQKGASLWTLSTKDGLAKKVKNSNVANPYSYHNPIFSKNGANIIFTGGGEVTMKSIEHGNSVTILDSCGGYILSPDNRWIMYNKITDNTKYLFRLVDKQRLELSIPEEIGEFVSWADKGNNVVFYNPSYKELEILKVASIYGGPPFELDKHYGMFAAAWSPKSDAIFAKKMDWGKNNSLSIINLIDQVSKTIDGMEKPSVFPSFSPDYSKILVGLNYKGPLTDLSILPFSLKDYTATGKPIVIFKGFDGFPIDCSWSPDGKKIAVCSAGEVWICDAEGGTPFQLTKTPIIENFPSWSPDGKSLAVFIYSTQQLQILKSSDGEVLTTFEDIDNWDWTHNGNEIVIAFEDGQINIISTTSGETRKIANWKEINQCTGFWELKCSPDGKWIALHGYKNDKEDDLMYLINISDGKISELVSNDIGHKEAFQWSPDSKWISYFTRGPKKVRLEGIMWQADLTNFMKKIKPGTEKGYTTDFDFKPFALPEGGIAPDGTFTDSRDGHTYKYKKIGEQTWMAEDLAYLPEVNPDSDTSSFDKRYYVYGFKDTDVKAAKNTENYQKFGVLYNWPATVNGVNTNNSGSGNVQGSCPAGWHVPSDKEWMILEKTLGMSEADLVEESPALRLSGYVGKKLKAPIGWDDDNIFVGQSGFNAIPSGLIYNGRSAALNVTVSYWTSTSLDKTRAAYRNLYFVSTGIARRLDLSKQRGLSIRCVKD